MTSNVLRQEVLKSFKNLHRTRCSVFKNDKAALTSARKEINDGYKKNKHVTNVDSIKELIKFANDVTHELRTTVVQMDEVRPGVLRMNLRPEMFADTQNVSLKKS